MHSVNQMGMYIAAQPLFNKMESLCIQKLGGSIVLHKRRTDERIAPPLPTCHSLNLSLKRTSATMQKKQEYTRYKTSIPAIPLLKPTHHHSPSEKHAKWELTATHRS